MVRMDNVCILSSGLLNRKLSLAAFQTPLDGMLVHRSVIPSFNFAGTKLYTWVKRGTVRATFLFQEHSTGAREEPDAIYPELSSLTIRPLRLS